MERQYSRYETDAIKRYCVFKDGRLVELPRVCGGIDFGRSLEIINRIGNLLLAKCPGHQTWSGIGQTRYAPTKYWIIRIDNETPDRFDLSFLNSEEVSNNNWRDIRRRFKELMITEWRKQENG